ncbi:MAG TPA: alpha/beta fold hydrolase [Solirubrobacterales bacterium]|nr:alpha/beta fold hydrolase [Solirubrobacterales bacterium]
MPGRRTELPARVEEWGNRGHAEEFRGRRIHCFHQQGAGPLLLLLHGFPTCSYDWRQLIGLLPERHILAFDFLGFGLSDKPRDHDYSLAWQADLTEELVRRHGGGPVQLVAHDMGTSVATELLARDIDGEGSIELTEAVLFNGSMIIERASLTPGQKLLRSRLGPLFVHLSSGRFFRQQLGSVFGREHPMSAADGADQWALMRFKGGNRIADKLIVYTFERARHAERWHGAIREWPKPLAFVWGMRDPVATTHVLDGLRDLRPAAPVVELPELAHYPQVEDPAALNAALSSALSSR